MNCPHCHQSMPEDGPVTVDLATNIVTFGDTLVQLTTQEADVLFVLNKHPVTTRDAVMVGMYGNGDWAQDKIVDIYICKLRKKLAGTALSIETIWGKGWRLNLNERTVP